MVKTIAIANHKGGVAKTTTSVNLGAALVELGRRVLLVDLDPQCNMTETLSSREHDDTVYKAMLEGRGVPLVSLRPGLDLVPGDKGMLQADVMLSTDAYASRAQMLLKEALKPVRKDYDFIIIDCPPSRNILTVNALVAADEVIIPSLSEILAVRGMKDMSVLIDMVKEKLNPSLKIAGLLLVMFGDRTTASSTKESLRPWPRQRP